MRKDLKVRVSIDHTPPSWDEYPEWFVTICTGEPKVNSLCVPKTAELLMKGIREYHQKFKWYADIAVLMPDHIHIIASVRQTVSLSEVIRSFKRWSARELKISWQRGFFEHRLRSYSSANQKFRYVLNNPVRAGLVKSFEEWPYKFIVSNRHFGRLGTTAPTDLES